jgi:cytochrome P450
MTWLAISLTFSPTGCCHVINRGPAMVPFETINIESAAHKAEAYTVYARLRAEKPICRVQLPIGEQAWLVSRYDDVSRLLKDARFAKDPANARTPEQLARQPRPPKLLEPLMRNMLGLDDPDHARLKKLVQAGFTPRRVDLLAGRTEEIAERLLHRVKDQPRFDLIADFALPLPVTVISELLGVPEADQARFARWSQTLLSMPVGSWKMVLSLPDIIRFLRYLRKLVAMKRQRPADDLVSALVAIEADGYRLSEDELLAMISILLSAGHETTTNLIGNGTLALLQHPTAFEQLRAEPPLMPTAVEELLRYAGPVGTSTLRFAREDLEIAGTRISRGDLVLGIIASANRDDRQFADADTIKLARTPNRHLTFGEGGHYCVGAALARMEGAVAFNVLLRRLPALRLDRPDAALLWRPGLVLRGLEGLVVRGG